MTTFHLRVAGLPDHDTFLFAVTGLLLMVVLATSAATLVLGPMRDQAVPTAALPQIERSTAWEA